MKCYVFVVVVLLVFAISCTPTAIPQLIATVTATTTPTNTPALTLTGTPTSTSTPTVTPSQTNTSTRTPTLKPTDQSTRGTPIFTVDWNGSPGTGWKDNEYWRDESVKYDFVTDPADPTRKVIRFMVTAPAVQIDRPWAGTRYWQNSFPTWSKRDDQVISAIEVKVYIPKGKVVKDEGVLGSHGSNGGNDVAGFILSPDQTVYAYTNTADGKQTYNRTTTRLTSDAWHTLRIEYRGERTLYLVDGKIAFDANFSLQAIDGHAGWQSAFDTPEQSHPVGSYMLQKDFGVETLK